MSADAQSPLPPPSGLSVLVEWANNLDPWLRKLASEVNWDTSPPFGRRHRSDRQDWQDLQDARPEYLA
ncbi:hypothetical protein JCM30394_36050 [Deferrisoma palaeochoriense]